MATTRQRAVWYSPFAFLRGLDARLASLFLDGLARAVDEGRLIRHEHGGVGLWVAFLHWDSDHFGIPTYRLDFTTCAEQMPASPAAVAAALDDLAKMLQARHDKYYLFAEVPAEDTTVVQAMGLGGMRLIETRLTYYRDDIDRFQWPRRAAVRPAVDADIPDLRETAATMRNTYDRFHADPCFSPTQADEFVATFVENSVKGFADLVMVPADGGARPGAFLTAKLLPEDSAFLGLRLGRMVLSAVSEARSGWYLRLIAEMSYWMRDQGITAVLMTTQSTNRSVIRVWERLGYRYGRCTHVFASGSCVGGLPLPLAGTSRH